MSASLPHLRLCRWLSIAATAGGLVLADPAWAADQKQVLVLYSTRRDAQIAVVGDRELPRILEQGLSPGLDYYSEFIDQARFSQIDYQTAFRDFLRLKYEGKAFDLVIAMGDIEFEFVTRYRDALFKDTPVVFFTRRSSPRRIANSTGVTVEVNLSGTLALAAELQPDIRHVFVVSGAEGSNQAYERLARTQFRSFEPRLAFTYLSGLPTRELEARLASLPDHSIVYYLVVDRDGANQYFNPLEYIERLAAVANAPIYCWVDSAMDHGIVGGSLKSQVAQTETIGALAVRVLNGERADSIPLAAPDLSVTQVDWRQLRRWGINEARVPPGTLVRFRDPSVWDRFKVYILGAVAVLLAQAVLITGLLVQRERRRRAEVQLQASQHRLRTSYERIRDLGGRLLDAQEGERSRIARELHDDIGQKMAVLTIDLQLISQCGPGRLTDAARLANGALDRAQAVSRSVRALSHHLHPQNLRLIGLVPALSGLQRELSTVEVAVTFSHERVPASLPHDLTLCFFRIAQEALQNAVAHSRAGEVSIRLIGTEDGLILTVADNGIGFDVDAARPGIGLISMSERAEQVGATLQIRSRRGGGTHVEVSVPFQTALMEVGRVI
jgi:signal transduction histidine kinase